MGFIGRFANVLKTDGENRPGVQKADTLDPDPEETTARPTSRLFRCTACAKTYVTLSMETCPDCKQTLEGIPNEWDLGMV